MPAPDSKQPVIHIRLHPKDRRQALRLAKQRGYPLSTLVRSMFLERLGQVEQESRDAK